MFRKKPPAAVQKLIGLPFEEKKLRGAFDDAGVRQWHLTQVTQKDDTYRIRKAHFYRTEASSLKISLRPDVANTLAGQLVAEFQKRVSGLALPAKPTMKDLGSFIASVMDPEILKVLQEETDKVLAYDRARMERKLETGRIYPWDHMRYQISRTNLPYLDISRAPKKMFEAHVANDVLESVRYGEPRLASF